MEKKEVFGFLDGYADVFNAVSDSIWDHPETCYTEKESAAILVKALKDFGFNVEENVADIETAFIGRWGHGKPVIGFLGEFDALPGLSQEAGCTEKKPIEPGGNGHGCGHNLLGVGCLEAAVGLKRYLEKTGKEGTVLFCGCPAEEGGSGKAFMARDGVFDELDIAISWHPGPSYGVPSDATLANCQLYFRYKGRSSHAGLSPELGRSALDAVTLMNVGIQFLREHVPTTVRMHYAVTDTGGFSPSVVQANAEALYLLRAPDNTILAEIRARVEDIARGAALMTGTELEIDFVKACSNILPNDVLGYAAAGALREVPKPVYSDEDIAFYSKISASCPGGNADAPLSRQEAEYAPTDRISGVSSDVGDVSYVVPTVSFATPVWPIGTDAHSWQAVAVGKSSIAHSETMVAGKAMVGLAIDLIENPELIEKAKEEHYRRLNGEKFVSPIPKGVKPRIIGQKK